MSAWFSNLSLAARAWSTFAICQLSILAFSLVAVSDIRHQIRHAHESEIVHLVEAGLGILHHFEQQATRGLIPLEQAQGQALAVLTAMRYQKDNYFFVADDNGFSLSNGRAQLVGTDIRDLKDPTGKYFVRELYTVAKQGGGFVDYLWPNPKANGEQQPKTSYARYFPAWQWTLGTGINIQAMEETIIAAQLRALAMAALIALALVLLIIVFIRGLTLPIARTIDAMRHLNQGNLDLDQRLPEKGCQELAELARHFNAFVFSLRTVVNQVNLAGTRLNSALIQLQEIRQEMEDNPRAPEKQLKLNRAIEHLLGSISKISERTRQMQSGHDMMRLLAEQDPLTGLLNRCAFMIRMETTLAGINPEEPHCLILADVDHFKAINDTFGHDVGDQVLLELAVVLTEFFGRHVLISRYGGEEFVIWLPSMHRSLAAELCEYFIATLHDFELPTARGNVRFTISMGLACCYGPIELKALLRQADEALHKAKYSGRDQYRLWCADNVRESQTAAAE